MASITRMAMARDALLAPAAVVVYLLTAKTEYKQEHEYEVECHRSLTSCSWTFLLLKRPWNWTVPGGQPWRAFG
jgi:hypothetical protein